MNLLVNGQPQTFQEPLSVRGLLDAMGLGEKPVVVEVNEQALFPRELASTGLKEGDVLEIVQITAGG